jgi:hypothetical protein
MRHTHVGGKKRRAWRLKKKYDKWFADISEKLILKTLDRIPKEVLRKAIEYPDCPPIHEFYGIRNGKKVKE